MPGRSTGHLSRGEALPQKNILRTIFCLALCWGLASGADLAQAQKTPLKTAFVGDLSAVTALYCRSALRAAQLVVEELNQQGGLLGRPVELLVRDGGNNPQRHHQIITQLAQEQEMLAIFGGGSSACLLQASRASRERKIPYLISVGNSQTITAEHGHPYVFIFEASSWMETKAFSIFATLMPWRRLAWMGPDYMWGREVFKYFNQHFEEIGAPAF